MDDSLMRTPEWSKSLSRELEDVISRQNMLTSRTRRRVLVSLQETSKKDEDGEMRKLREKAIAEIINSEKSYLRQLEIVEEFFMKPIQESAILPQQIFASIFGDILGIRQVNKELLAAMEVSTEEIGKVFLELAPYLKFYSTYANDFEKATKLVEEWTEKHKGFRALLSNQESRPEVQKKLNALLITPIQRIPRYKLLLDDVLKNTPRFHPDKNNLEEARTQIDAIAWYINDQIKDHEHNLMMVYIQKSLQGGLPKIIKPGRKLLRQGNLMKVSKNGGHAQPRYVVLFSDMLMYCKFRGNLQAGGVLDLPKADALEVCCVLPLKQTKVEQVVGKGVFTITCGKENLVLYSTNAQDTDWVDDIRNAISLLKKNSASLKRQSSKFEPMRKPDILKLRRESLSRIMLSRKTEESRRQQLKDSTHTSSPLMAAVISPMKRKKTPDISGSGSPFKLTRILESPPSAKQSPYVKSAGDNEVDGAMSTPSSRVVLSCKPDPVAVRVTPPRLAKEKNYSASQSTPREGGGGKPRQRVETSFRKQPRNSLRSLSLHRRTDSAAGRPTSASVFRSPSIYEEPRPLPQEEEDAMRSYLSGMIVPLTPSTRPTNVEHLAKKEEPTPEPVMREFAVAERKQSYCSVS